MYVQVKPVSAYNKFIIILVSLGKFQNHIPPPYDFDICSQVYSFVRDGLHIVVINVKVIDS